MDQPWQLADRICSIDTIYVENKIRNTWTIKLRTQKPNIVFWKSLFFCFSRFIPNKKNSVGSFTYSYLVLTFVHTRTFKKKTTSHNYRSSRNDYYYITLYITHIESLPRSTSFKFSHSKIKKRNNNMIETRIAHQLNRIAGAAAAAVQSNNTITNIVEFAIIALFQFKIVVIAHTNCLPKFCFRCFERDERKNTEITSGKLCVFRCSLCMNFISALAERFLYKIFRTCSLFTNEKFDCLEFESHEKKIWQEAVSHVSYTRLANNSHIIYFKCVRVE